MPGTSTSVTLLLACLAGEEWGAAAIVESCNPVALCFALAAWCNTMHGRADFASVAEYEAYLRRVQAAMAADEPGLPDRAETARRRSPGARRQRD